MHETQESISAWAEETFGPAESLARVAARANEEMAELLRAITAGKPYPKIMEEAADVAIVLERFAEIGGFDDARQTGHALGVIDRVGAKSGALEIATFANLSLAMLMDDMTDDRPGTVCGDRSGSLYLVFHALYRLVTVLGGELDHAIDAKMEINRVRRWTKDGTGHGYHERAGR